MNDHYKLLTYTSSDEKQNYPDRSQQHKIDGHENNPLHDACRKGDLGRVRYILSRGLVDVDGRDEKHGRTPLMAAAEKGHRRVFDFLIRKGANVSQVDDDGYNILHWACRGGHMGMVRYLLSQQSVDIHSRGKFGSTPLMKAVYYGHRDMFKFLVSQGANVSQVDDDGDNILHWACIGGHVSMVKYLLSQHIIDINSRSKKGKTPLMKAAYYGQSDVLKFLVSEGANVSLVDDDGDNILHWACIGGQVGVVKYLLSQYSVDINSRAKMGKTPLMKAAYYGHRDVLEFLVSKGANVSMVDDDGDNIIHYASIRGQVEVLKHIISRGIVNIRSRGKYGRTPLMRSAYYGNRKVFDLLVSEGGRISSVDDKGYNILHLASIGGRVEMVKHILSQNMTDINSRNKDGETAAMIAMRKGHPVVYDFLVSRGCSLQ
ncbi:ankyrin repeat domain-containing protein 50-like [Haliotis rufescens]|uniref:ankyrin repeat domain-containing protein 50-like n=1 Tax=Haliotis rufescens TaxID=6454 RepID=UPI00201F2323|nr:ankyrin repeat domain-containing protein 50-like [Haliotis rufescens]